MCKIYIQIMIIWVFPIYRRKQTGGRMKYLNIIEFRDLTEPEKAEYYEALRAEKNSALTANEKEQIAMAYEAISGYHNSSEYASDLMKSAKKQRLADARYIAEKRKKGALIALAVLAVAVIAVICVAIASIF